VTPIALAGVAARWTLFAAVLVCTGAAVFHFLVLARLPRDEGHELMRTLLQRRTARLGAAAANLAVLAVLCRFPLEVAELRDESQPLIPQLRALGLHTTWGAVWLCQLLVAAGTVAAFVSARRGRAGGWRAAAVFGVLLAASPAFSGHAIGSERLTALAVAFDALHVIGASAWLGTMVALLAALSLVQRQARLAESESDGAAVQAAALLVARFSPVALAAAAVVITTGLFASWLHLGTLAALWQSRYGRFLAAKLAAVGIMAGVGVFNWRRAGPALRERGAVEPMRRSVGVEIAVGAVVLLATAVLVATPQPGEE
jgi:putative copper export protein